MKTEKVFKTLGVLSFSGNSVADFGRSPPVSLLREGTRVIRGLLGRHSADSPATVEPERVCREAVERSRKFREMLHRRATAPYIIPVISYYRSGPDK